jgi:hypothetical protein
MIKKLTALFLVCLTLGLPLAACDVASDMDDDDVEVEVDD